LRVVLLQVLVRVGVMVHAGSIGSGPRGEGVERRRWRPTTAGRHGDFGSRVPVGDGRRLVLVLEEERGRSCHDGGQLGGHVGGQGVAGLAVRGGGAHRQLLGQLQAVDLRRAQQGAARGGGGHLQHLQTPRHTHQPTGQDDTASITPPAWSCTLQDLTRSERLHSNVTVASAIYYCFTLDKIYCLIPGQKCKMP